MSLLREYITDIFPETSEEYKILEEAYEVITSSAHTISAEAKTDMILLDNVRTKLSTLYYMLGRSISRKRASFQTIYDTQYARLVKLGRPSNAAIEAEIRTTNPGAAITMKECAALEEVKNLVEKYIRCVDSAKTTALELLRDSRRVD